MGVVYCAAIGCHNNRKAFPRMTFFKVPKDKTDRWKKWIINSRRDGLLEKGYEYCSKYIFFCPGHFEQGQFMNENRNKLVWNAVPTLFSVPNPPPLVTPKRPPPRTRAILPDRRKAKDIAEKASATLKYIDSEGQKGEIKRKAYYSAEFRKKKRAIKQQRCCSTGEYPI